MADTSAAAIQEIRAVLAQFQAGYDRRDSGALDAFMDLFSREPGLEVIGTGGVVPGDHEWCLQREAVRTLVDSDWKGWGDLKLDVKGARVFVFARGEVGWLATTGTVALTIAAGESYRDYLAHVKNLLEKESEPPSSDENKVYEILRSGSNTLAEMQRGEHFVWPIRFTALLVHEAGAWRFHQMQFSFATTRYPDVRSSVP